MKSREIQDDEIQSSMRPDDTAGMTPGMHVRRSRGKETGEKYMYARCP